MPEPVPPSKSPLGAAADECWVITNGAAGNERQALALAEHMPWPVRPMVLQPRAPWSWLAPRLLPGRRRAWPTPQRTYLTAPWPRMVIGCGRAAGLATRTVSRLSEGQSRSVQILAPRISPAHWNSVIAPQHDGLAGSNVFTPTGSLNPIDEAWLQDARRGWGHLARLPAPRIGILLGGPRHDVPLDSDWGEALAASVRERISATGGSVLLLASRRTPDALLQRLRTALHDLPGIAWGGAADGTNPFPGVLAWADRLVVTPDSVNMLSEACATGVPVHTLVRHELTGKLAQFHADLRERGLLHDLDSDPPDHQAPLRETADVATALCRYLSLPTR